jgi:hypothetical protein
MRKKKIGADLVQVLRIYKTSLTSINYFEDQKTIWSIYFDSLMSIMVLPSLQPPVKNRERSGHLPIATIINGVDSGGSQSYGGGQS